MKPPALRSQSDYKYKKSNFLDNKMIFDNYLLDIALPDLENKEAGFKWCELYPIGASKYLKPLIDDIKLEIPINTLKFVGKEIGSNSTTIHCWLIDYNKTPLLKFIQILDVWRRVCNKSNTDINRKLNELFEKLNSFSSGGKSIPIKLPRKMSKDLGYLIGFLLADGYIKSQTKLLQRGKYPESSIVFYDNSKKFLQSVDKIMSSEFGANCNLHYAEDKKGSWYALRSTSKPIHRFFTEVLKIPSGNKQGYVVVPKVIKNSSIEIQKAFISGFCDGEGCVGISTKNPYFEVAQASYTGKPPQILEWISDKLNALGINISKPQIGSNCWRLRTASQKVINNYYSIISSRHNDKIPKFEEVKRFSYARHGKKRKGDDRT
jgi:hypothetical protein